MSDEKKSFDADANRDPISGEPGAHPVGTGIGAAGAGAVGAAIGGVLGGPVGAAVGTVVGSVAGGLIGKSAAESVNPTEEDAYWHQNYASEPYYESDYSYEDYQPAYRTGYEGFGRYYENGRSFDEVEPHLKGDYETNYGGTGLGWEKAKHATRAAWHRVERTAKGNK